jgi:membrane associated rhomboid family serine protease
MRTTIWDDFKTYILNSGNVLNKLLAINVGVFIIFGLIWMVDHLFAINGQIDETIKRLYVGFPSLPRQLLYRPWSIVTYQFTHQGFMHVLSNMIILFMGGRIFREFLGDKKLLNVYLLGGAAGALMFMLAMNVFPAFRDSDPYLIGASASAFAILVAAATLVPNYTIFLILIGPVRLVYIMLFFFVLDLLSLAGGNGGGHFSHIGGAAFGFIYIRSLQSGTDIGAWLTRSIEWGQNLFSPKANIKVSYRGTPPPKPTKSQVSQDEVDSILDKIAKSGYDSLNQGERDILFRASKDS